MRSRDRECTDYLDGGEAGRGLVKSGGTKRVCMQDGKQDGA